MEPIPVDEALPIARQIAEALEAAHEQGIIHRDLKPANIKVRPDGTVKVLDFGLAKALESTGATVADATRRSPTITSPAMMTGVGMILGTAAYMSPEQARGKPVDKRADIWAFGCVLYEMLTGQRAFGGEDVTVTLARVVEREPDFDALPRSVPPRVRQALRVCLRKDPKQRVGDIRDVRLALEGAFEDAAGDAGSHGHDPVSVQQQTDAAVAAVRRVLARSTRRRAALVGAAALVMGVILAGGAVGVMGPPAPRVTRLTITTPSTSALTINGNDRGWRSRLTARASSTPAPMARSSSSARSTRSSRWASSRVPRGPFVSPDGQWVGFVDGTTSLRKVAMTGGPAVTLAFLDGAPRGATWARRQ